MHECALAGQPGGLAPPPAAGHDGAHAHAILPTHAARPEPASGAPAAAFRPALPAPRPGRGQDGRPRCQSDGPSAPQARRRPDGATGRSGCTGPAVSGAFFELAETSECLARTASRRRRVGLLSALLARLAPGEAALAAEWLSGRMRQGRLGIGPAQLRACQSGAPAPAPAARLRIDEVDAALDALLNAQGPGSRTRRQHLLEALFARADEAEGRLLTGVLSGALRQGALEGLMVAAIAEAATLPLAPVRQAYMLSGDLGDTARRALGGGLEALGAVALEPGRPVLPMLAQPAASLEQALAAIEQPVLEHKLDGARVQLHKDGGTVRVYARGGGELTGALPELRAFGERLPASRAVLDGEALVLRPDGRPCSFQTTMRRFGRRADDPALRRELPLTARWFDCLLHERQTLIGLPGHQRLAVLDTLVDAAERVPRQVTRDPATAADFLHAAFAAGHEGIMVKDLQAPYEAGNRGAAWLKIKRAHTLDLVVLAAEWGSGRRQGWLSNLHLGARQGAGFAMLGKTFKGLTDATLQWQTGALLARETARDGQVVHVRPELVVEIAFANVQRSRHYPSGLALRLARVVRYRPDKDPGQAAELEALWALADPE